MAPTVKNYTGDEIKTERLKRGWGQVELGRLAGASGPAVSKWESGQTVPTSTHMLRLNAIFLNEVPEPSRVAELEAEVSRLRDDLRDLRIEAERLARDAEEFRTVMLRFLAIDDEPGEGEAPQSGAQDGQ